MTPEEIIARATRLKSELQGKFSVTPMQAFVILDLIIALATPPIPPIDD